MPLDPLQERVARTALTLPQARTLALAGGGAMIVHRFADRMTKDIDLFTEVDDQEAIAVVAGLRAALHDIAITTRDADREPFDHRFVAVEAATGAECTVEVFADGGRLRSLVSLDIGSVLHPEDLAADKVLALWGRARPRDYFDVVALLDHYSADELLRVAGAKDAGFTPESFVEALRAIVRFTDDDWAEDGIAWEQAQRLRTICSDWRDRLEESRSG